ncbi:MAG TPA: non-ribosomal peptide synthetase [Candidatus Binatia bacterium]|nr:non-ribosomal peptide synthetase [Candidatus Binatia bacterium]
MGEIRTIRQLIDRASDHRPQKTLLIDPESGRRIRYGQLRTRCLELESRFREHWLKPGDFIALLGENSLPFVEHLLASMYAGLIPVPLNVLTAPLQLSIILNHCSAKTIFVSNAQLERARAAVAHRQHRVRMDLLEGDTEGKRPRQLADEPGGRDPLESDGGLLIYTSGTTDQPKGALFNHANLVACAANSASSHFLTESDRLLSVLPFCHMNAVDKLLGTISVGGSIVLAPRFQLDRFWDWVVEYRCTWLSLVPTIIAQLISRQSPDSEALAAVRFARSSSAPLPAAHREAFEAKFGIPIREGMGMTEAGSVFLNPPPPGIAKPGSVGTAIGFEVRTLDPQERPTAPGHSGTVWVRGTAIMQGYYGQSEMTAKTIEKGWLNTGDVGYFDHEGYLFLAGRTKEIIIKSGVNIAPREIDEVLHAHPSVREAATVGVPDSVLGEDIIAYVVPEPGLRCEATELLDLCQKQLGSFRTPRRIYFVNDLPRGPSGKVQRLNFAATGLEDLEQATLSRNSVAASTANEISTPLAAVSVAMITQIWAEVLNRNHISLDDDFFAIGGTSLLATQLLMRMEREFSVELSLENLLLYPTVAAQVKLLDRAVSKARRAFLLAPIRDGCRQLPLFCIHGIALYRPLAVALGSEQPTYGLSPNLVIDLRTGEALGQLTLNDIAARYLGALREIQPRGPYYLVGFSFGGRVALEIARRLHEAAEEVAMLSVVDTYLCCVGWRYKLHWFGYHVGQLVRTGPGHLLERLRHAQKLRRPELRATQVEAQIRAQARKGYRAQPYPGDITLFRALARYGPAYSMDEFLGWRDITQGRLEVHEIPGDHYSMLNSPNVELLAQKLRTYLPRPLDHEPAIHSIEETPDIFPSAMAAASYRNGTCKNPAWRNP